ncbi:hypothetical protein ACG2K1_00675 [Neisseria sp. 23W00296]|uniref:hypothetical protein n=1 Tax=unclassified Neisseria TaxID=2623750 RepID=UPI003757200E
MNGTAAPNIKRPSENRFYGLSDGLRHSGRAYRPPSAPHPQRPSENPQTHFQTA